MGTLKNLGCVAIIAILSTLTPGAAHSADSLIYTTDPQLDSVVLSVFNQLNVPATGSRRITTAVGRRMVNRAVAKTCTDFHAYEKVDSQVVIARDSVIGATLPADYISLKSVQKRKGDSLFYPMIILPPELLVDEFNTAKKNIAATRGLDAYRHVYEEDRRLRAHPKMRGVKPDTFVVAYWAMAPPASASDTLKVASEYLNKVIMLTCSYISALKQDYAGASWYMTEYEKGIVPRNIIEQETQK